MSSATASPSGPRRRRLARVALALALLGVVAWQVRVHTSAWRELKDGRAALERDDASAARPHLDRCLESWPRSAEANFLAARAARRCGDLEAAQKHLATAERCGHAAADVEVEKTLLRAQSGQLAEVAPALVRYVADGHKQSAEILALIVPLYLAEFRVVEAGELTVKWVTLSPDSVRAWTFRADVLERLRKKEEAVTALRRLTGLAPENRRARFALARMLLETRQAPDEAAGHLEWLTATDPGDIAAQVQLAACREAQGRPDEAASLLDRVIAGSSDDAKALHYRGRLEMNQGRPTHAAPFLRRAAKVDPSDVELLYTLFVCIQQTGTPAEVRAAQEQWRQCDADLRRVGELARAISTSPDDPELRRQIGELFLRNGRAGEGVRWLESALRIRPDHAPTHRVLADYFDRRGQPERAAPHRSYLPGGGRP